MGYTKLFSEIVASSIWSENDKTRIVWITMLALKDRSHFVRGTVDWLATCSRVSREDCVKALEILKAPDEESNNPDHDGRRVLDRPGGWFIVSGERYAKMLSHEQRQAYNREKQREYRARNKLKSIPKNVPKLAERNRDQDIRDGKTDIDGNPLEE